MVLRIVDRSLLSRTAGHWLGGPAAVPREPEPQLVRRLRTGPGGGAAPREAVDDAAAGCGQPCSSVVMVPGSMPAARAWASSWARRLAGSASSARCAAMAARA